jgi:hypothetical protein
METLKIYIFESGKSKPDQVITIPLSKLNVGKQLLPTKTKSILEKEGIDISDLSELTGKRPSDTVAVMSCHIHI